MGVWKLSLKCCRHFIYGCSGLEWVLPSWLSSPRKGFLAMAQWVSAHLSRDELLLSVKSALPQLTHKWRWLALLLFHFSLHFPPLLLPLTHQKQFFRRLEIEHEGLKRKANHSGRHAHLHKHPVYSVGMSWFFSSMAAAASGISRPMLHRHSVIILGQWDLLSPS